MEGKWPQKWGGVGFGPAHILERNALVSDRC